MTDKSHKSFMDRKNWQKRGQEYRSAENDDVVFMVGLEDAFVGLGTQASNTVAIYDRDKVAEILMTQDRMRPDEVDEWIEFNVAGAWVGANTPVLLRTKNLTVAQVEEMLSEGDEPHARADTPAEEPSQSAVQGVYVELLERDRARLNWLEKTAPTVNYTGNGFVFLRVEDTFAGGLSLREAIDCAMQKEP